MLFGLIFRLSLACHTPRQVKWLNFIVLDFLVYAYKSMSLTFLSCCSANL